MVEPVITSALIGTASGTLGAPTANFLFGQLKAKIDDSTPLDDMHKALKEGLEKLLALRSDKAREVDLRDIEKQPSYSYVNWAELVSNIEKDATSLNEQYEEVKGKNWNIIDLDKLRKKIKKLIDDMAKHVNECPEKILIDKPQRVIKEICVPPIADYPTLNNALQRDILPLLQRNNGVKCVALYGQKGVGKTTVMRHLNNHFYDKPEEFEIVIFIKVSADERAEDIDILQKIADRMKLDKKGDEVDVARKIQRVLEDRRYLLILDGIRNPPHGIWEKLDISNDKSDSKVVISILYDPAQKLSCVQRAVRLETLTPSEAWRMFKGIDGAYALAAKKGIARKLCKRFCYGLPLLMKPVANTFKSKRPEDLEGILNEDTHWPHPRFAGLDDLYSTMETCYEQLSDQIDKKCFLYAALYPANSKIYTHYLAECCIAQDFLDGAATTKYSAMRGDVEEILSRLVDVSLLVEGEQMRYVKMNDFHRQVALYISSKDSNSESRTYVDNEKHDERNRSASWQGAKWVSMINSRRNSLPTNPNNERPNYKDLQTLMLQKSMGLVQIPQAHFDGMPKLLVLNLYGASIKEIPPLSGLSQLKAFYLNGCSGLENASQETIQPLQHLEVLDIRATRVNFVPVLKSLRCLRISYIAVINCKAISGLDKLEELTIEVNSLPEWRPHAEDIILSVTSLKNLTTFICSFPSLGILESFLLARESQSGNKPFTSFHFFVGCETSKHPKTIEVFNNRISKYVRYCDGEERDSLSDNRMLPQAEAFELISHKSIETLWDLEGASNLECLRVEDCNQILTAVDFRDPKAFNNSGDEDLLPSLEQLHLDNLQKLNIVFWGPFHLGSFSLLQTLTLKNCPKLTDIFFAITVDDLNELQKLEVQNCPLINVLIKVKKVTEGKQSMYFPKLRMLILDDLPNLVSICPNGALACRSLEHLKVQKCGKLRTLPFNKADAVNLVTIECQKEWWNSLK